MELVYRSDITRIANSKTGWDNQRKRNILNEARCFSRSNYRTSIFLSHSHKDADMIMPVVVFLRTLGVDVYVDWMDKTMSEFTSGETAIKLKEKIRSNEKFLFLATDNSLISKWCNWEVGYGDAHKYINKIVIFPLRSTGGNWNGQEYLQIYPCIKKSRQGDYFYIVYPDGRTLSLTDWLKQ